MNRNYKNILIILFCAIVIMLPMFLTDYHSGHDTGFHIANVISLKEQLQSDNINANIVGNIANNFGYGTRLFYPPLAHSVVAYTSLLSNLDVLISFKIVYLICLFLSGVSLYFLSLRLSKSKKIALVSAIIYMAFPYHISDIYIRDALAETFLFVFLPLIFLALTYLFENKKLFYLLFISGYVGGILSHFTLMIYFTLFLIPFFVINKKKVFKRDSLIALITSAVVILLITLPFFVTMFEHKLLGNYAVFLPEHMAGGIWWAARNPFDYINIFKNFNTNNIKYYLDIVTMILLAITLKNHKKIKWGNYKFIIIFGLISFVLSTVLFPWDILPGILRMIQFPWRLETFVAITISLIAPLCLDMKKHKNIYIVVIIGLLFFGYLNTNFASKEKVNLQTFDFNSGLGWQKEYLPVNALNNQDYLFNRNNDIIIKEKGTVQVLENKVPKLSFKIDGSSIVEFPRLYYFGYVLKDESNKKIDIYENKYGFIEAKVDSGTYYLTYEGSMIYKVAKKLSLYTFILSLIFLISWRVKEWKKLV
ncbi:MAG: hypothetical protein RR404_01705 [Bacilli bacterium]